MNSPQERQLLEKFRIQTQGTKILRLWMEDDRERVASNAQYDQRTSAIDSKEN